MASMEDLAAASWPKSQLRSRSSQKQGPGQGVNKAGLPGKGHEDQGPEGDLSFSQSIRESEIIDFFLVASLKDEVLEIMPMQT